MVRFYGEKKLDKSINFEFTHTSATYKQDRIGGSEGVQGIRTPPVNIFQ